MNFGSEFLSLQGTYLQFCISIFQTNFVSLERFKNPDSNLHLFTNYMYMQRYLALLNGLHYTVYCQFTSSLNDMEFTL